jgi:arsenite-transporting ATPase
MRIILYTGKGGVGKTSLAAATACINAGRGRKTLIVSTDAAHSLGDSFDRQLSPEPEEISPNLWAQEIDSTHEIEQGWGKVQEYLTALFTTKAIKDITTEELTVFPGMEDLLSLLRILKYYKEGRFDCIIIDCAPTGETLSLLSFPELLRWWMDKLFSMKRKAAKVIRPIIQPFTEIPLPGDDIFAEIENIYHQLDEMREVFSNREVTSIRIVVNPEKMVIKEAQRSFTYLNIYNFNIDGIIVNRVIPADVTDEYFSAWKDIQKKYRTLIDESFSPVPVFEAPLFEQEVVGIDMLRRMGETVFEGRDPEAILYRTRTQKIEKNETGYIMTVLMPFTGKDDVRLSQKGDELIIRVGALKRIMTLPRSLVSHRVTGAKFEDGGLKLHFEEAVHAE